MTKMPFKSDIRFEEKTSDRTTILDKVPELQDLEVLTASRSEHLMNDPNYR
jgi:hypothetical protein